MKRCGSTELYLRPLKIADFRCPEAVPEGNQKQGRVSVSVAAMLGGLIAVGLPVGSDTRGFATRNWQGASELTGKGCLARPIGDAVPSAFPPHSNVVLTGICFFSGQSASSEWRCDRVAGIGED